MKILDDFFNFFLRCILRVCTGAPIPNLYWQTGFLKAGNLILQKKLLFCHHLSNLPEESLGRRFFDLQCNENLEGLVNEVKDHLEKLGVADLKTISKNIWKKRVNNYIKELNKTELLGEIKKYKKLDYDVLKKEDITYYVRSDNNRSRYDNWTDNLKSRGYARSS